MASDDRFGMSEEGLAICHAFGNDPEEIAKTELAEAKNGEASTNLSEDELGLCHTFDLTPEEFLEQKNNDIEDGLNSGYSRDIDQETATFIASQFGNDE